MLPSGCGVLDGFAENKSYFQKRARATRTHSSPACQAARRCWQLHPPARISWYSSVSDASWMRTRGVQNHSSHDIISNPFWVLFPGGKGNQSDRKRKIFQAEKQCFTVDKVLQLRRLSTGPSSQRWHAASWHFCGLCWERVNAMWAVVNLRSKKNREGKRSWELQHQLSEALDFYPDGTNIPRSWSTHNRWPAW